MTDQQKATAQDVIDTLRSIDASLKVLVAHFGCVKASAGTGAAMVGSSSQPSVAADSDLDSQYGDPVVKSKDPRDWSGDSMMGLPFSECPPDYLDLWAQRNDYFAQQADDNGEKANNGKPLSYYKRKDAARARGWAQRKRTGWQPPAQAEAAGFPSDADDDSIAF